MPLNAWKAPTMRILQVSAELFPLLKTGGLADIAGALPAALVAAGVEPRALLPGARLPSVRALHLVDRTAIAWQAKDLGRDTLVSYHLGKTLLGLPFRAERRNALYRKLEGSPAELAMMRRSHPAMKNVVPTLASLLAERND